MTREILGSSKAIEDLKKLIAKVAPAKTSVLIFGESGTGKELVARAIHEQSPWKSKPFIPVNCGAIPETLMESELFGHKRGSFTGAVSDKMGLFEAADGGTLFLDEVGEIPLSMQVKLLRALQDRTIRKVGGTDNIHVDVRIVAATNRDLEGAIAAGTFREDLYYRLNVIQIRTPSLRERQSDIELLAETFLERLCDKAGRTKQGFEPEALKTLRAHSWPGNVRELENTIERAFAMQVEGPISVSALPRAMREGVSDSPSEAPSVQLTDAGERIELPVPDFSSGRVDLDQVLGNVEKIYIEKALKHAQGVKKNAADLLGITFRSIRYRLKKLGLE